MPLTATLSPTTLIIRTTSLNDLQPHPANPNPNNLASSPTATTKDKDENRDPKSPEEGGEGGEEGESMPSYTTASSSTSLVEQGQQRQQRQGLGYGGTATVQGRNDGDGDDDGWRDMDTVDKRVGGARVRNVEVDEGVDEREKSSGEEGKEEEEKEKEEEDLLGERAKGSRSAVVGHKGWRPKRWWKAYGRYRSLKKEIKEAEREVEIWRSRYDGGF